MSIVSATAQIATNGEFSTEAVPRALIAFDATPIDLSATMAISKFYDPVDCGENLVQAVWTSTGITHQEGSDTATGMVDPTGEVAVFDEVTGVFLRIRKKYEDSTANGSVEITTASLGLDDISETVTVPADWAWVRPEGAATVDLTTGYTAQFTHPDDPVAYACTGEADTEVITASGHTFANDDPVVFTAISGGSGLATATLYYVISVSGNDFSVSTSVGGAAVDFTTDITAGVLAASNITAEADTDIFTVLDLDLSNGEGVIITAPVGGTGLTGGNTYYVINKQADGTFQLSTTADGSALNITTDITGGVLRQAYANLTFAVQVFGN